ncbi:protein RIC-3 isoform X2 [Scyliorhinus canicula]|uniref:protein RIC-3 isoform X2 n=1 Tax=Scyliorhinus canicula TaxID=7830 RepID=UPI0018F646FF|nr:protein RIC-3 isoform X2 [Scyliorhinus canicula]
MAFVNDHNSSGSRKPDCSLQHLSMGGSSLGCQLTDNSKANLDQFSPMRQRPMVSQQWSAHPHFPGSHQAESVAKAKAGSNGGGNKSFMSQVIPVYGFGLFMYVLYILFKISFKGSTFSPKVRKKCTGTRPGNMKRKITDYELAQLQEKLKETEVAMEKLVLKMGSESDKITSVTTEQEEKLLRHLKEITSVIKKGKLIEGISPEKEAEESPYTEDWEGYPEETDQLYCQCECSCQCDTYPNYSEPNELSAEELAERIGTMEGGCSSSETIEDKIRQNKKYQAPDHQQSTQIGVSSQTDSIEVEELQREDSEYEDDNPAITVENCDISFEILSDVDDQVRDESNVNISVSKQKNTYKDKGVLRKRIKMVLE